MQRNEFNLRPIQERDLDIVLAWRNSDRVRACMYRDHVIEYSEHLVWFERTLQDEFPTTLIFEYNGIPAGLKSFSRLDFQNNSCYWGFYLGNAELPCGCGSVMGFLALEYIFDLRGFRKVCAEAFAFNEGSLKYHARLGFRQEGRFVQHVIKNGRYEDIISFAIFRENWLTAKPVLAENVFQGGRSR